MKPTFLKSTLLTSLNLPHAWSVRDGALDASDPRQLSEPLKAAGRDVATVRQVHGAGVHIPEAPLHAGGAGGTEADAMVTDDDRLLLAIRVADCGPILLSSAEGRVVAAVHAGWRGVVAGVTPAAVRVMVDRFNLRPDELFASIGPCISAERYEVGPEVAEAFREADLAEAVIQPKGSRREHVDLRRALVLQLTRCGIDESRIEISPMCTFTESQTLHSHRRDGDKAGRNWAIIGPRAGAIP